MITTFLFTVLPDLSHPITCFFPGDTTDDAAITVGISPQTTRLDGRPAAAIAVDNGPDINAVAGPITTTDSADVMVRALAEGRLFYTVAFDETGAAALNRMWLAHDNVPTHQETRTGHCSNAEHGMDIWLGS